MVGREPLQQRADERIVYEKLVEMSVDVVNSEFKTDEDARMRVYGLVADNFKAMVRVLSEQSAPIKKGGQM